MNRTLYFLPMLLAAGHLYAAPCAATPEAAVRNAIGAAPDLLSGPASSGYRVQDVQVDAVMRRVWVRVIRCEGAGGPPVLVALGAPLAQNTPVAAPNFQGIEQFASASLPMQVAAIHAGDVVKVFFASASVQMEVEGTADAQAAVGDLLNVTLKRAGDEPPHRIHGVLRADHRVEVQP